MRSAGESPSIIKELESDNLRLFKEGKVIGQEYTHCEGPLYPEMTAEDHAEEQAMEQASLDYDIAQDMNTEDLMEYYRDCDRLEEIEACI